MESKPLLLLLLIETHNFFVIFLLNIMKFLGSDQPFFMQHVELIFDEFFTHAIKATFSLKKISLCLALR